MNIKHLILNAKWEEINQLIETGKISMDSCVDELLNIKSTTVVYYDFAKNIPNAPIGKIVEGLCLVKGMFRFARDFYLVAKDIPNAPIEKLAEEIIASGSAAYMYLFAKDIQNAPIEKLADGIVTTDSGQYMYLFARDIPNAPIENLADGVIATGEGGTICLFAANIPNAPIEKLAYGVIATNCAEDIYGFARLLQDISNTILTRDILNALIEKLAEAVIETGDEDYICLFAANIPNAPIKKLEEGINKISVNSNSFPSFAKQNITVIGFPESSGQLSFSDDEQKTR